MIKPKCSLKRLVWMHRTKNNQIKRGSFCVFFFLFSIFGFQFYCFYIICRWVLLLVLLLLSFVAYDRVWDNKTDLATCICIYYARIYFIIFVFMFLLILSARIHSIQSAVRLTFQPKINLIRMIFVLSLNSHSFLL